MIEFIHDHFLMLDRAVKDKEKLFDILRKAWQEGSKRQQCLYWTEKLEVPELKAT